jgi:hypothetical protein
MWSRGGTALHQASGVQGSRHRPPEQAERASGPVLFIQPSNGLWCWSRICMAIDSACLYA